MAEQYQGEKLDYGLDWSSALAKTPGDAIAASTWTPAEAGLTFTNATFLGAVASVWIDGGVAGTWYTIENTITTTAGRRYSKICLLHVKLAMSAGSALFPNRFVAIAKLRRDRLMMAATASMPTIDLSDDYLWDKLRAAESEIAHTLRVPLGATTFFPLEPTTDEIAALNGMPWAIDPGYDYEPGAFGSGDKWGLTKLRNKPLQSVSRVRFAYPGGSGSHYDLPLDWLRMDRKYGTIQFVPSSTAFIAPLNAFVMQAVGGGRTIPLAIQITYVAGLANAAADYPELLDVVMKKAALKIIEDAFLPQSGSISADGLSQSMSTDMEKHYDTIDRVLNGGKGSNGGLMTAIHGIRLGVM
jgi:hypothetical protein